MSLGCSSSAAGIRRLDITSATLTTESVRSGRQRGTVDVERETTRAREIELQEQAEVAVETNTEEEPVSTRGRDLCIMLGIVTGVGVVIGALVAIDPFQ